MHPAGRDCLPRRFPAWPGSTLAHGRSLMGTASPPRRPYRRANAAICRQVLDCCQQCCRGHSQLPAQEDSRRPLLDSPPTPTDHKVVPVACPIERSNTAHREHIVAYLPGTTPARLLRRDLRHVRCGHAAILTPGAIATDLRTNII